MCRGLNPGRTRSGEKAWRKHTLRNSFPAPRSESKQRLCIRPKPSSSLELHHLPSWSWRWIDSSLLRRSCRRLCCWLRRSSCPPWTAAQKTHSLQWDRSSAREWVKLGSPNEPEWSALGFSGETSQWIMGIHSPSSFRVTFKTPNCKSKAGLYKICIAQNTPACWFTGLTPTTPNQAYRRVLAWYVSWITYLRIHIRNIWVIVAELFNANVHFLIASLDIVDAGLYLINLRIVFKESSLARAHFCSIFACIRSCKL